MSECAIKGFFDNFEYLWTDYILRSSEEEVISSILSEIIHKSGKEAGEAVLAFFSAIRYVTGDPDALRTFEKERSYTQFVVANRHDIVELAVRNRVQANYMERAFPVLDVINMVKPKGPVHVIELGASMGAIGKGLLFHEEIIAQKELYLKSEQQLPLEKTSISRYTGIELQIPDRKWFLSCIHFPADVERISRILDVHNDSSRFSLLQGNAFGFEELLDEKYLQHYNLIILTSFMLYQFNEEQKKTLVGSIKGVLNKYGGHWINQSVIVNQREAYFVELDEKPVIRMIDDLCGSWEFL